MSIRLSFCIPTLNFGPFIGETLRSIASQAGPGVEIVVVDGGSTDDTVEQVANVTKTFPAIRFIAGEPKRGVDRDILRSVEEARGDFCWLFSSDDLLAPDAIGTVLAAIDEGGWDWLLTAVTGCDRHMKPLGAHCFLDCPSHTTFDLSVPSDRNEYFRRARLTTAFGSFISNVVVNRKRWLESTAVDAFVGSCWIIAAKFFAMDRTGMRVRYEPRAVVLKRGDNDSFLSRGVVGRVGLSVCGLRDLASYFCGKGNPAYRAVSKAVSNEYPLHGMLYWKMIASRNSWRREAPAFVALARRHYEEKTVTNTVRYFIVRLAPPALLRMMYAGLKMVRQYAPRRHVR
jgi:abequosyltransferase